MTDTVLYETAETVAVIRLNRPSSMNALTAEMKTGLLAALRRAAAEPVRAVLITGNGRGFCAGQDLVEHAEILAAGDTNLDTVREHYNPIMHGDHDHAQAGHRRGERGRRGGGRGPGLRVRLPGGGPGGELRDVVRSGRSGGRLGRVVDAAAAGRPGPGDRTADAGRADARRPRATSWAWSPRWSRTASSARPRWTWSGSSRQGPTAAYAAIKEALLFSATHGLPESLEEEAELQNRLGRTADHKAATRPSSARSGPATRATSRTAPCRPRSGARYRPSDPGPEARVSGRCYPASTAHGEHPTARPLSIVTGLSADTRCRSGPVSGQCIGEVPPRGRGAQRGVPGGRPPG